MTNDILRSGALETESLTVIANIITSLQHVCQLVVKGREVPVMVQHCSLQCALMLCWDKAQDCVMPNGCMLSLAFCMDLQQHRAQSWQACLT